MFNKIPSVLKNRFYYILALGGFLRFYHLGYFDLWFDEILSTCIKKGQACAINPHTSLYFDILRIVTRIFGDSQLTLRFLSAVSGSLVLIVIYKLGKTFFNKNTALLGVFLLAISPFHIWYSQEARVFAFLSLIISIFVINFVYVLRYDKNIHWLMLSFIQTIAFYTSYWSFILSLTLSVVFVFKEYRAYFKKWVLSAVISLLCFLPALPWLYEHVNFVGKVFWVSKPQLKSIFITFENFNLGYNAGQSFYLFSLAIFGIGVFMAFKNLSKNKRSVFFLALLSFIPILIVFIISQVFPIYVDKIFLPFAPYYYLLTAYGFMRFKYFKRSIFITVITLLMVFSLLNYYKGNLPLSEAHHEGVVPKKSYRIPVEYVESNLKNGDILVFTVSEYYASFLYYFHRMVKDAHSYPYYWFYDLSTDDKYWLSVVARVKGAININEELDMVVPHKRVWLIAGKWIRDGSLDSNSVSVKNLIEERYRKLDEIWCQGIYLGLYGKHIENL